MDGVLLPAVPGRLLVWGRAGVLGTVALGTGVVSHVAGGGRLPGLLGLAVLLAVSVLAAASFLRVRVSAFRLVLLVVAGQTMAHAALSGLAGHGGSGGSGSGSGGSAGHVLAGAPGAEALGGDGRRTGNLYDHYSAALPTPPRASDSGGWLTHQVEHLVAQGPLMVLTHLLGAVVLALFLAVGERALWRLLLLAAARHLVGLASERTLRQAAGVGAGMRFRPVTVPALQTTLSGSQVLDRDTRRLRGPPFLLAA